MATWQDSPLRRNKALPTTIEAQSWRHWLKDRIGEGWSNKHAHTHRTGSETEAKSAGRCLMLKAPLLSSTKGVLFNLALTQDDGTMCIRMFSSTLSGRAGGKTKTTGCTSCQYTTQLEPHNRDRTSRRTSVEPQRIRTSYSRRRRSI